MSGVWKQKGIVERLRLLVAEGHSADQIAARLSAERGEVITRNAVIGKCDRERFQLFGGILKRQSPPEPKAPKPEPRKPSIALLVRATVPLKGNEPEPKGTNPPGTCQWIHGEAEARLFCGHPVHEEMSWCTYHCHRVFDYEGTNRIQQAIKKQVKRALR